MNASEQKPEELALTIQEFVGRKFNYPAHIIFLFELATKNNSYETLSKLMFTAKYVTGLKKIVSSGSFTEDKYLEKIFKEFNVNVQNMINTLDEFLEDSEGSTARELRNTYLKMDHESLAQSLEFAGDLSSCKEFFNRNEEKYQLK